MIEGAWYLILLCGLAAWAGTRIATWQDDRNRTKRIQRIADEIQADINATLKTVAETAEEVKRARHEERRPND